MTGWVLGCEARSEGVGFADPANCIMKTTELHCSKLGRIEGCAELFAV